MSAENPGPEFAEGWHSLVEGSRSNSEAFSIIGMELIEVKAMLMTLIDLQKSSMLASGVSESVLEENVENLLEGYRRRYLSALSGRIKEAADQS